MKYTYSCGMDDYRMTVEAKTDDEAVGKLRELGKQHVKQSHANAAPMTDAEFEADIRAKMKKS